ncbi:lysophospholipid acyltransferase family protein [Candidatus Omnitrophota bacterium]
MIFYFMYRIGIFLALSLPLKWAYRVAILFSDLHYLFAGKDRANVAANLRVIFPEKRLSEIRAIRLAMTRNFAKYLVDFFRFPLLEKETVKNFIDFENLNYLDGALAKGKGGIILSAHISNWELAGAGVGLLGYPLLAVALPHRHKAVDDFFNRQRQEKGMSVIPLGRAARQCFRLLRENKLIALVGDRVFNSNGILIDFFGLPTRIPAGPAAFSLKADSPIIPAFMRRNADDRFTLVFEKPVEFEPSGDKDKDIRDLTYKCSKIIEQYIRRYPEQWFMFRKFWVKE